MALYAKSEWEKYIPTFIKLDTFWKNKEYEQFNKLNDSLSPMVRVYYTTTNKWVYDKQYFSPKVMNAVFDNIFDK